MLSKAEHRFLRIALSSLLNSDLSVRELREIARQLIVGNTASQLSHMLLEISESLDAPVSKKVPHDSPATENMINSAIQRRRFSRRALFDLLLGASETPERLDFSSDLSMRDMVRNFLQNATQREIIKLSEMLNVRGSGEDPYLKGIARR